AVGPWLRGIAFHLLRAEMRQAERRDALAPPPAAPATDDGRDERHEALRAAFARLSGAHQTVLRMHSLQETVARAVAALHGPQPKAVEDRLYHARRTLRELVATTLRTDETGART